MFPVTTQTVPEINSTVQIPREDKEIVDLSESIPAMYAVAIDMVSVTTPEVLLKITTASPAEDSTKEVLNYSIAPSSITLPENTS
jgi:hypothetical protein